MTQKFNFQYKPPSNILDAQIPSIDQQHLYVTL